MEDIRILKLKFKDKEIEDRIMNSSTQEDEIEMIKAFILAYKLTSKESVLDLIEESGEQNFVEIVKKFAKSELAKYMRNKDRKTSFKTDFLVRNFLIDQGVSEIKADRLLEMYNIICTDDLIDIIAYTYPLCIPKEKEEKPYQTIVKALLNYMNGINS